MTLLQRPLSAELHEAIEHAYVVFENYRLSGALDVCRCDVCMDDETERELLATPLREIPPQLLAEYTNSAHGWNDGTIASDMRYFLPRYLELIANDQPPDHLGLGTALRRLGEGTWRISWPPEEVEAVARYFDALVRFNVDRARPHTDLLQPDYASGLIELFELVAKAGGDLDRALHAWDSEPDPAAAIEMAIARQEIVIDNGKPRLRSIAFEDMPSENECIGEFLMRPSVARRIVLAAEATNQEWLLEILARELFPETSRGKLAG